MPESNRLRDPKRHGFKHLCQESDTADIATPSTASNLDTASACTTSNMDTTSTYSDRRTTGLADSTASSTAASTASSTAASTDGSIPGSTPDSTSALTAGSTAESTSTASKMDTTSIDFAGQTVGSTTGIADGSIGASTSTGSNIETRSNMETSESSFAPNIDADSIDCADPTVDDLNFPTTSGFPSSNMENHSLGSDSHVEIESDEMESIEYDLVNQSWPPLDAENDFEDRTMAIELEFQKPKSMKKCDFCFEGSFQFQKQTIIFELKCDQIFEKTDDFQCHQKICLFRKKSNQLMNLLSFIKISTFKYRGEPH